MNDRFEPAELASRVTDVNQPLPEFDNPPVVEVSLSVQFEALANLRTPQIGLLWEQFRDRFPKTEDHPPLDSVLERFGVPPTMREGVRFQMLPAPPVPRCWFLNQQGTELVQIQQDRFVHNWRKVGEKDAYPRYEQVRKTSETELTRFRDFVAQNQIGELSPNQCEVTYVNHILSGEGWTEHAELAEVLAAFTTRFSDSFLPQPEDARMHIRFVIAGAANEPLGRLHVSVEPDYHTADDAPMLLLTLTARGRPMGGWIPGVMAFLDLGRQWIVRGFTSITTDRMHSVWRRKR